MKQCAVQFCLGHSVYLESQISSTFTVHHTYLTVRRAAWLSWSSRRLQGYSMCVCVCVYFRCTYQRTPWTAISILTVPGARMHSSPTLWAALGPGRPWWPEDGLRARHLLIAESGEQKKCFTDIMNNKLVCSELIKLKRNVSLKGSYIKKNSHRFDNIAFGHEILNLNLWHLMLLMSNLHHIWFNSCSRVEDY